MPDDKLAKVEGEMGAEEQRSGDMSEGETAAAKQFSPHAFHSTWEELYQRDLHNAAARKAYQATKKHERTIGKRQMEARRSSRCSSSGTSDCSSDSSSIDGDEWFGPECGKILSWLLNTLKTPHNHPLKPYFRRVHALCNTGSLGAGVCRGDTCHWCKGEGPLISQEFKRLPILDVGCGGGQFLARLRRCGFQRLAGVDYSHSAIQLARSNLCEKAGRTSSYGFAHICLRQADLRHLRADKRGDDREDRDYPCICCCSRALSSPNVPADSGEESGRNDRGGSSPCSCKPATRLPPFPVVFDKGTFDVFWLMRTPELYVQCMHRLMPQYSILFLTSCNCTIEDLDSLFCAKIGAPEQQQQQKQQQAPSKNSRRENTVHSEASHQAAAAASSEPLESADCRISEPVDSLGETDGVDNGSKSAPEGPLFERIGLLPHRSFKFGGVEGQVVTSVLLRRI
ncbi:hypothetical protein, conserved [Eimeria maxima]|uniref:Methyltransferase domain-containing protein n=1 Tax=Eimeria maxima TaxID=5804 RepID=U6M9E4_EIMMA|nr:hypothetical protein, conserved [Eimeria maxima]CDJ58295.1 hypothetical protein, conserved [Eimeria maxima]